MNQLETAAVFHSTVFHLNSAPPLRAGRGPVAETVTGPGVVGLGGQIAMIDKRHEHGVAAHQVDPLERFCVARRLAGKILQADSVFAGGNKPAIGRLQRHAAPCPDQRLETRAFWGLAAAESAATLTNDIVLRIGGQEAAVGAAGQRDGLAHRNLALDAARARLVGGVVIKVRIATGLARVLKLNRDGRTPWNVVNWKVMVKGLPRGVNCLPSALQLKMASSVSKLHATRSHRWLGGLVGPIAGGLAGAAPPPRRRPPPPV